MALAKDLRVNYLILAGDISGKFTISAVCQKSGDYLVRRSNLPDRVISAADFEVARRDFGNRGYYVLVTDIQGESALPLLESQARTKRIRQWIDLARAELEPIGAKLLTIPGNDDAADVVDALAQSTWARDLDGKLYAENGYAFVGFGYSNPTPWETPRELSERQIRERLESTSRLMNGHAHKIAVIHVPPFGIGLDLAPEVVRDPDGTFRTIPGNSVPVGSVEVAKFVESEQPLIVASGHCHDSAGYVYAGRSLCLNPGSAFQLGILHASLVVLEGGRVLGHQSLTR